MATYEFKCDECNRTEEVVASIKDGPPKGFVCSNCGQAMYQIFCASFILKGSWPGKDIKAGYQSDSRTSELSKDLDEYDDAKKEAKKVLAERRKGKKNFKEWQRHNKPAVDRYKKNLKKGIKGNDDPKKSVTLRDLQHQNSNI